MKENNCEISFECGNNTKCVHRGSVGKKYYCEHLQMGGSRNGAEAWECTSSVAKVNRMVLELKELGFKGEIK